MTSEGGESPREEFTLALRQLAALATEVADALGRRSRPRSPWCVTRSPVGERSIFAETAAVQPTLSTWQPSMSCGTCDHAVRTPPWR